MTLLLGLQVRHSFRQLSIIRILMLGLCLSVFVHDNGWAASESQKPVRKVRSATNSSRAVSLTKTNANVVDGVIVVKLKSHAGIFQKASGALSKKIEKHSVDGIREAFPFLDRSVRKQADDLRQIYYLDYGCGEHPADVASDFAGDPSLEYAEPVPEFKYFDSPNDPLFLQQTHFSPIEARAAWDIIKGEDGNVVIAIVDFGIDWEHEDLVANIWTNEDEIADNGMDDDDNGFIDDIRGWNFANDTNNPKGRAAQPQGEQHGTHVAGIAAGVSNNSLGIAGVSWNCQIMPVNVASTNPANDSSSSSETTFAGVVYAAENGAHIINASWGFQGRSTFGQDIIDFAHANGSLVITAAGNNGANNDEVPHIPSNLNHVLSVGSTSLDDRKSSFSNYGVTVDVFAPGESILSTLPDNQYGRGSGTSFSTPILCGIAGLVKALHSDWTPDQVREQVRVTAESIDSRNPSFAGELGKGRANALRALTVTDLPSIRIARALVTDSGGDGRIEKDETAELTIQFTNFLEDASNISVAVSTKDDNVVFSNADGALDNLVTNDTSSVTFQFSLQNDVPEGHLLGFIADISTANYTDRDFVEIAINPPELVDHDTGTLQTSITTQGNIGFVGFAEESPGVGFIFKGTNFLFEGGLMIGTGPNGVSDCIRGTDDSRAQDDDFKALSALSLNSPGLLADQEGSVILDDSFAAHPLGIQITQESFAYSEEPFQDFVIFRYFIENRSGATLDNLRVGLFFDWDISANGQLDYARFNRSANMGIIQNSESAPTQLAATKVLTPLGATSYRSINNPNEIYGGDAGNGFTNTEKWNFLSNGIQAQTVDATDVSTLTSTGPFTLGANEGVEVAFAVIGGSSTNELSENAALAQYLWDNGLVPEIDQSPPAISTSVLQNPAASKYADIVVISDRLLAAPPEVEVQQGSNTTNVTMSLIAGSSTVYKGPFEFTTSGTYTIQTQATGFINAVDSTQDRSFVVAIAEPGQATTLTTLSKRASLHVNAHALSKTTYFMAEVRELDNETIYRFGPVKEFLEPLRLEIVIDPERYPDFEKLFVYHKKHDRWLPLRSHVFPELKRIRADVRDLGEFKILYNPDYVGTNLAPGSYALKPNYPNPFNPTTTIEYDLPSDEQVTLTVFNTLGQAVRTLVDERQSAGGYKISWDGTDQDGRVVSSGVYFFTLKTANFSKTNKMILLK